MKDLFLAIAGLLYAIDGVVYIQEGDVLWGLVIMVISAVYFFGFEKIEEGSRHKDSHILAGGIFSIVTSSFVVLEKLMSLLSEPIPFSKGDVLLLISSVLSIAAFLKVKSSFV